MGVNCRARCHPGYMYVRVYQATCRTILALGLVGIGVARPWSDRRLLAAAASGSVPRLAHVPRPVPSLLILRGDGLP